MKNDELQSKPEIVEVGAALDAIQWNLEKGPNLGDSQGQGNHYPIGCVPIR